MRMLHHITQTKITPGRITARRTVTAIAAAVAALAFAGCGQSAGHGTGGSTVPSSSGAPRPNATESNPSGDIPDSTQYVPYGSHGYEVKVPEGWARTDLTTGASFTDKLNTVRVETNPAPTAPTAASARAQELPKIQAGARNFKLRKIEAVQRHGGTAVRMIYETDSTPNPVTGKVVRDAVERYEFFKGGRQAVLTLTGPVSADNVDPWRTVSDGFRWTA
ncbi:MAG: lipoprotein [Streptosporangiaceae bacterium]|jgi:hypothetical protein|nr:lipoprotein [Streptosporangiaceae bacterium]